MPRLLRPPRGLETTIRRSSHSGGLDGRAKKTAMEAQNVRRPVTMKLIRYEPVESNT